MAVQDDRGLLVSDGLFETLLWRDGRLDQFAAHMRRLADGCQTLGLPAPGAAEVLAAATAALEAAGLAAGRAAVRVTWTAGAGGRGLDRPEGLSPQLYVRATQAPAPGIGVKLHTSQVRRNDGSPASRLKSLAYLDNVLARREARAASADEALMLNSRGEVCCAAAANLFWVEVDRLVTPALDCGVLAGVTRAAVLAAAAELGVETREVQVGRAALDGRLGLFLTNSLIGVAPVISLDGRVVGGHPLVGAIAGRIVDQPPIVED